MTLIYAILSHFVLSYVLGGKTWILNHPISTVLESETRRQILRLIACEHNYGNRIVSILGLSTPAVHRHLKILQGLSKNKESDNLAIISKSERSIESYSGYKGAEATL